MKQIKKFNTKNLTLATAWILLSMAVALLIPCCAMGQNGDFTHQSFGSDYEGVFGHQSFGSDNSDNGLFTHQSFGSDYQGDFGHQSFGYPVPIGSGLFVLLSAGMGYASWKRKKQQINKKK